MIPNAAPEWLLPQSMLPLWVIDDRPNYRNAGRCAAATRLGVNNNEVLPAVGKKDIMY